MGWANYCQIFACCCVGLYTGFVLGLCVVADVVSSLQIGDYFVSDLLGCACEICGFMFLSFVADGGLVFGSLVGLLL